MNNRLKPLALVAGIVALASACSPAQHAAWLSWHAKDPAAAEEWAANDCGDLCTNDTNHNGIVEPDVGSAGAADAASSSGSSDSSSSGGDARGSCSQWYSTAIDAGFSDSEWDTVSYIMARESGCDPGAYNPSGASGLMQIMSDWADNCGGSPSDLFSPWFNLHCAVYVHDVQGWGAWSTY